MTYLFNNNLNRKSIVNKPGLGQDRVVPGGLTGTKGDAIEDGPAYLIRDERTPGAVAVIQQTEKGPGLTPRATSQDFSGAAETNSFLPPDLKGARIIGYGKLRNLLRPSHSYFEDKWASIKCFCKYLEKSSGKELLYPQVKSQRGNPYRKYQLNRQCSARTGKAVLEFIDNYELSGVKVIDFTATKPVALSSYLATRSDKGKKIAWDASDRLWERLELDGLINPGLARHTNLHTWSSENPLNPHYHEHSLVLNHRQFGVVVGKRKIEKVDLPQYSACDKHGSTEWLIVDGQYQRACCYPVEEEEVRYEFKKDSWYRDPQHHLLVWSPDNLARVKAIQLDININLSRKYKVNDCWKLQDKLYKFQIRHGVNGLYRLIRFTEYVNKKRGSGAMQGWVDVWVSYIDMRDNIGKAKFVNTLSYNGRSWEEDFAYYSNKNPECADPPEWLKGYSNKARVFGYWRDIKVLSKEVAARKNQEKEKLSPYTAEKLEYKEKVAVDDVLQQNADGLIAVDMIRGKPIERMLSNDDLEWLKNVGLPMVEAYGY